MTYLYKSINNVYLWRSHLNMYLTMKTVYIILFVLGISITGNLYSQSFTDIGADLTNVTFSAAAWGDYDNDSDLDLIIMGMDASEDYITKLYRNDGTDIFTEINDLPFPDLAVGDVAFGDYDNDGDLDILIQGALSSVSSFTGLYQNKGNDEFTEAPVSLVQLYDGAVSWADYNNDGYLDILYSGFDDVNTVYSSYVYQNNKDGTFTLQSSIELPGVIKGVVKWADYDKDGDMDFLLTGLDFSGNLLSKIYKNDGDGSFTEAEISMIGVWLGDAAWGDFDMDGDPDLLLTGFNFSGRISKIYVNEGNDVFTDLGGLPFPGLSHSSAEWGDYDNDGDLDIFFCGVDDQGGWLYYTMIYTNEGNNTFTESGISFQKVFWGESLWGDYDADGDLDLVLTGYDQQGNYHSKIYRNDIETSNTVPQPPATLISSLYVNDVTLAWSPAVDEETPSLGLTYNSYLYRQDGDTVWSAMSNFMTGQRLLPESGNTCQDTAWTIRGLEDGEYYWSVQSIDNCFEGSAFAPEESFVVGSVGFRNHENDFISISPNPSNGMIRIVLNDSFTNYELHIINQQGKIEKFYQKVEDDMTLDLKDFRSGLYLFKFSSAGLIFTKKLLIQK